ncbi:MAG: hypothetical protein PHS02_00490, partial [Candidatus ainarchaeum sp.]|nr:hypothetical protein [Candidatus ainarchaeum sp.]
MASSEKVRWADRFDANGLSKDGRRYAKTLNTLLGRLSAPKRESIRRVLEDMGIDVVDDKNVPQHREAGDGSGTESPRSHSNVQIRITAALLRCVKTPEGPVGPEDRAAYLGIRDSLLQMVAEVQ